MKRKLVDPVHLFDSQGYPVLGYRQLEEENRRLKAELKAVRNSLRVARERIQMLTEQVSGEN